MFSICISRDLEFLHYTTLLIKLIDVDKKVVDGPNETVGYNNNGKDTILQVLITNLDMN